MKRRNELNKSKIIVSKKRFILVSLAISLILLLIPLLFTPILSDDFIYIMNNTQWSNLSWRYMNWSGRLVADAFSLIILQFPSIIYIIVKAIIWFMLILLISYLPSIFNRDNTWKLSNYLVIFLLYWIANPNLGETSFWTVGFANYLLTNFFIVAYLALLFYLSNKPLKSWHFIAVPLLGFLAGNSNENTSIIVVLLTLIFLLIEKRKKVFLLALPFAIAGTLVLLLSPGQYQRLQHPAFQIAREQSLFRRLWNYFSSPWFIETFKSFSWVFVTFILIGFIYFFRKQYPKKRNLVYSVIFFFSAIIANAAFGGSYVFPVAIRSLNGALILFLISIAFISEDLTSTDVLFYKKSTSYVIFLLCIPFLFSYIYSTRSVISLHKQFDIREKAILTGKASNKKTIYIPNYYVGKLYSPSDSVDLFQGDLKNYYNLDKSSKIVLFNKDFSFDYANSKLVNAEQLSLKEDFAKDIKLVALNILPDTRSFNQYSVNVTFDANLTDVFPPDTNTLFIHVNWKRGTAAEQKMFNADTSLNNQLSIDGKYIFSSPIGNIRPQDVTSIDLGIYNTETKTNTVQMSIDTINGTVIDKKGKP